MTAELFFELFHKYGLILVCAVIFLEHMNLPFFPAGVIMPSIGVLAANSELSFALTLVLSVVSGVLGSLVIYTICYFGGELIMRKLFAKSPKFNEFVEKCHEYIDRHKGRGLALCRLIPVLRTIVSFPAGLIRMNVKWFCAWSAVGIAIWNTVFIGAGFLFSEQVLARIM